ncbi:DUF167 domain-containing protein [Candidatus Uhrbacteria bacterium]|nr:DUF167 domain-containing protein [Candidatus Uhrbacteria bacterium]
MRVNCTIIPNASKNEIISKDVSGWKIRIVAPPIDGKANKVLIEFLAEYFCCAKSCIQIIKGQNGRKKILDIQI